MKKISILTAIALLFSASITYAQILKKDVLLGGTLGYSTGTLYNSGTTSNVNISPRLGYAIGNNSVLSARFGYAFFKSKGSTNLNIYKTNSITAGLSWKKFISVKEKFGLYTDLYGTLGKTYTRQESGPPTVVQKTTTTAYTGGLNPGVYYLPLRWLILSVDAGGLNYTYNRDNSGSHTSSFVVNFLSSFTFGVDFILTKGKG